LSASADPATGRLAIFKLIGGGIGSLRDFDSWLRLGIGPISLTFLIDRIFLFLFPAETLSRPDVPQQFSFGMDGLAEWLISLLSLAPVILFMNSWTRHLLLGPGEVSTFGLQWGRRENRSAVFYGYFLLLLIPAFAAVALPVIFLSPASGVNPSREWIVALLLLIGVPAIFILSQRFMLLFSAIAVDEPLSLREAYGIRGWVGLKLFVATSLAGWAMMLPMTVVVAVLGPAVQKGAPHATAFLGTAYGYLVAAVWFAIYAFAFRNLTGRPAAAAIAPTT
jgi:hypothetical protein